MAEPALQSAAPALASQDEATDRPVVDSDALREGEGWQTWLDRHGGTLMMLARQWAPTYADAEDIVQEAFVKFWRSRDRAKDPAAYLYTCVKTSAIDAARARKRREKRQEQASQLLSDQASTRGSDAAPLFETLEEEDHRRAFIETALRGLAEEQREVLIMKVWGGLTFNQIGASLGISPNTAASRYRYALKAMRKAIPREMMP